MIRVLAIGNSFSQDAMAYLHDMAFAGGIDAHVVNLYIGGCPLRDHWENAEGGLSRYDYELNGRSTGRNVSIREALCEGGWDFVTFQQVSGDSGLPETYFPYLTNLSVYVRQYAPNAVQLIHETWAYETDSDHPAFEHYGRSQQAMFNALRAAYRRAAAAIGARPIVSGDVIQALRAMPPFDYAHGGQTLCRDGYHMHLLYGRYTVAAVWYECVLGGDIRQNGFVPHPDAAGGVADDALLDVIRQTVHRLCTIQPHPFWRL